METILKLIVTVLFIILFLLTFIFYSKFRYLEDKIEKLNKTVDNNLLKTGKYIVKVGKLSHEVSILTDNLHRYFGVGSKGEKSK